MMIEKPWLPIPSQKKVWDWGAGRQKSWQNLCEVGPKGVLHNFTTQTCSSYNRSCTLIDSLGGFLKWGYPLAGWFISWKIPIENGWWLGVPLWLRKLPLLNSKDNWDSIGWDGSSKHRSVFILHLVTAFAKTRAHCVLGKSLEAFHIWDLVRPSNYNPRKGLEYHQLLYSIQLIPNLQRNIDILVYLEPLIYINTRNAWALPRLCSVEGPHSQSNVVATLHSIGKINKGIREY